MRKINIIFLAILLIFCSMSSAFAQEQSSTRIKDIAKIQGVRSNQLIGYGLVIGLAGTGDSNKSLETIQSITNMLKTFGVTVNQSQLQTKNVAAVMVTAQLPPFVNNGDTIDVTVSSMGDAKSLQGGTLLQTPLKAANGTVYAVGQGAVSTGGFIVGKSVQKNFVTVGSVPNGAIVERTVETKLGTDGTVSLSLSKPDFTTANRIATAINSRYGSIARSVNPGTVDVTIPFQERDNLVGFVSSIEELNITPDNIAKVVINERTGTIVMGSNISVDKVAIAQGGLSIKITKTKDVNQPPPFSGGDTVVTQNTDVKVDEPKANVLVLDATANVGDIVTALNTVGATPRDIISILQAMKASGALHADLEII